MVFQHLKYFLPKFLSVHCTIFRTTKLEEFRENQPAVQFINTF